MSGKVIIVLAFAITHAITAMDNLEVVFQWKQLDFAYNSNEARQAAIANEEFIPENNLPLGMEVASRRIFITIPRWKKGVPASLAYILLSDSKDAPLLRPYPNWEAHKPTVKSPNEDPEPPEIISSFRLRADRCNRLWVMDAGMSDILGEVERIRPPRLLIFNLNDDTILRKYEIPPSQHTNGSFFANIAVEDNDCNNAFAYLADISTPALVVYSWSQNDSWQVKHNYFNIDPLAGDFNVSGISFQWTDGIFGLALSDVQSDGYSKLYFHPLTSTDEFVVSTKYLRDTTLNSKNFDKFYRLGTRGPRGQSSVSFLDKNTGVLFYALVNLNAIACWKTTNPFYTMQSQGRVYMSNVTMLFPNDLKVDSSDNLWVLSDRLPVFMYSELDKNDVNFRILMAPVKEAIKGTACDSKLVVTPEMTAKMKPLVESINSPKSATKVERSGVDGLRVGLGTLVLCLFLLR